MSEMIERVARTLYERTHGAFIPDCAAPNDPPGFVPASWDSADVRDRDHYLANARAAISIMREPTDIMTHRGQAHRYEPVWSIGAIWREMIDSALSERREKGNG